ncbi:MAG TPA: DUF4230 domain-containing protein [Polyangiaceae bacterium]|jgi:hypothetical protein|nr:DUF4230 domain-containing protein [Polyangiaceae bacterium]
MTDSMLPKPKRMMPAGVVALVSMLGAGALFGVLASKSCNAPALPVIPPLSSSVTVVRPTANVLIAVQDLARLESASFHMERVIDLTDKQSQLFGLIQTEDAILLVAVANVSAGVDLQKLTVKDIVASPEKKSARLTLPAPEVFHAELDNSKTYVHTRRTGALATRQENLETRARQEAERTLVDAALQAGLLARASENARRAVEGVVRALGYEQVEVTVRPAATPAASAPAASAPTQ